MIYLDTSLVVSALAREPLSDDVRAWLGRHADDELWISDWTATEVSAALAQKVRTRVYDEAARRAAAAAFRQFAADGLDVAPVLRGDFRTASDYLDGGAGTGLRAGDAVHLAVSARLGATLRTLDVQQAEAGRTLGLDALLGVEDP